MTTGARVPDDAGRVLLPLPRSAIASRLGRPPATVDTSADWLAAPGAAFVTLTLAGRLRGCIGTILAHRPLAEDVQANARNAAFSDPRFSPLTADEYDRVQIEVSVLTEPEPMRLTSRADALAQLQPGVDGILLSSGGHRATFLPQVWEQLPDPDAFLSALMRKAGLPADHWDARTELERYRVRAWHEGAEHEGTGEER